jgi:hypothetical protein
MTSYFNLNEYSDLNPDLKQNNIIQKNQLWEHFIKYGIHEDREYKKYEKMILNNNYLFDSIYYINTNPDLIENNINTYEKAWEHYILYGIHEGRDCMKNDNTYFFDHDFYAQKYKDLLENGIYTKKDLLKHWINHGLFEKRVCNGWEDTCHLELNTKNENEIRANMKLYKYNNNLLDYIKRYGASTNYDLSTINVSNYFIVISKKKCINFDLYFYKYVNNIEISEKNKLLEHLYENAFHGLIYHPNQLKKIYENINIYKYGQTLIIENDNMLYDAKSFIEDNIYNKTNEELSNILIKCLNDNFNETNKTSLLILFFIGNEYVGDNIINKLIHYKNIEKFNIAICFNSEEIYDKLFEKIKDNFDNFKIYISKDFGNDITPTMLMYNDIIKSDSFEHIIKLHTKTHDEQRDRLINFLLDKSIQTLITYKRDDCNCIGHEYHYINYNNNDGFNRCLINRYINHLDYNNCFLYGTIFYCNSKIFDKVLDFIKNNNFMACILNNLYDDNMICYDKSYIHFYERLFGIIK